VRVKWPVTSAMTVVLLSADAFVKAETAQGLMRCLCLGTVRLRQGVSLRHAAYD
jgi:hypothetical protein